MKRKYLAAPYSVWMVLFIIVPLIMVVWYAFTDGAGAFTSDNIVKAFGRVPMTALLKSLWLALISTAICLFVGYPAAMALTSRSLKRKSLLLILYMVPMWMNFLLRTYAWSVLLERTGIINMFLRSMGLPPQNILYTSGAVVLGMVYNFLPFMILPIHSVISKMDPALIEAAEDLGASKTQVFLKVRLPLSVPGIISGITMTFMPAASTFVISQLLGNNVSQLYGEVIEQQFRLVYDYHYGSALSLVLMVCMLLSMLLMNRFSSAEEAALW
ncbi:MAG: ABC transporter permease [Christensenellales bacterium]